MTHHISNNFNAGMAAFVGQDYGKCIESLTEVLREDQTHTLALVSRGAAFMRTGEMAAALADLDRAIAIDPGYARAYHLRGLVHESQDQVDKAVEDFSKAIELKPDYGAAYHSRATLYAKLGQTDHATEDIQMVAQLTQHNIETFANENNVWRSHHLQVEAMLETELNR